MEFASDNTSGVHPRILDAIGACNDGTVASYGADPFSASAAARLAELFETEVQVRLVATGTAANALALSALVPPYGTVFCHGDAHINTDECGAPELFTGGAKLTPVAGRAAKITPEALEAAHATFIRGFHQQLPAAVAITQATEFGTLYTAEQIAAIGAWCRGKGLRLHMDGARFANAVAALGASPAELTWKAGVDVLSFGATKNGAMGVEAVVFFDPKPAERFAFLVKRAGHVISKGRYLGAQMVAYLEGGLWLETARHANSMATRLAGRLGAIPAIRLAAPVEANAVFAVMPRSLHEALLAAGAHYYDWPGDGPGLAVIGSGDVLVRFVCSFLTRPDEIDRIATLAERLSEDPS
ncbi:low specificity L-threonine aldolase [Ancylobacter sp. 6x-1]|uniref:L-threonine aldolase n=1 Tax=Ancylobacter crimeensis TaxID=2579147 RepID=A0ABT0DDR2_9HYPH|nr:low specificity L-threonine aldolase [Ancylobacter crimeensis]MCK0198105.1 low specificity L-threonine aldolase [Ancylobacter crimeensis]